jgi:hypothetical protein
VQGTAGSGQQRARWRWRWHAEAERAAERERRKEAYGGGGGGMTRREEGVLLPQIGSSGRTHVGGGRSTKEQRRRRSQGPEPSRQTETEDAGHGGDVCVGCGRTPRCKMQVRQNGDSGHNTREALLLSWVLEPSRHMETPSR